MHAVGWRKEARGGPIAVLTAPSGTRRLAPAETLRPVAHPISAAAGGSRGPPGIVG
jgi:hypothetical protein